MKKLLFLFSALALMLLCPTSTYAAKAETEDYVADSYLIEIAQEESFLPVPNIPSDWIYSIMLKDGETVLGEGISKYLFTQTGEYTLVYTIHKEGSLTDIIEETATLRVADIQKPTITVSSGYEDEYFVGDELLIQTATVNDNVDKDLSATVELYRGEEKLSVQNNKYLFEKTGEYQLVYKAVDSSGNENSLTYKFTVVKKTATDENIGCAMSLSGCSSVTSGLPITFAMMGLALVRLKKQNKNKKGNDNEN